MSARLAELHDYLAGMRTRGFEPGTHDCALFVAGWARKLGWPDLGREWRGRYRTTAEGRRQLRDAGIANISDLAAQHFQEVPGWFAATAGDIAIVHDDNAQEAFGIVGGAHIHVLAYVGGLNAVPLDQAIRVFRP